MLNNTRFLSDRFSHIFQLSYQIFITLFLWCNTIILSSGQCRIQLDVIILQHISNFTYYKHKEHETKN